MGCQLLGGGGDRDNHRVQAVIGIHQEGLSHPAAGLHGSGDSLKPTAALQRCRLDYDGRGGWP